MNDTNTLAFVSKAVSERNRSITKYPLSIRILHWTMALTILGLLVLGYVMTPFDEANPDYSHDLYFWHKSFGLLVLILFLIRLFIRTRSTIPKLPETMRKVEKKAAKITQITLYGLMFTVPFLGALMSSTYEFSSGLHFFIMDLPDFTPKNEMIASVSNFLHRVLAYSLLAFVCVHVLGAIKHRFFDKENDVISRIT